MGNRFVTGGTAVLGLWLAAAPFARASDDVQAYAEELSALRSEVARFAADLEAKRDELRSRQRSLSAQKADLEMQIRREEVRLGVLQDAATRQRELIASEGTESAQLVPVVEEGMALMRAAVFASLPYRTDERVAELDKLERQLDEGVIRPQQAASRLWQFAEDEMRLSRENALDRQVVELGGQEVLADVARLGMVALYFRTGDGTVGYAANDGGSWSWRALDDPGDSKRVTSLFDALEKQIRTGWFELPAFIPEGA